jgi:hypothetical protein
VKNIKIGSKVKMGKNRKIPVRYHGRSGWVVGKETTSRGGEKLLVEFYGRKATPLEVSTRFATAL